jgi:alkanesulfonate monooxygenase SsuD/methylene tetrahydromethanopterin reductase-like flavin-dependent oxidoreductase (luciferase family)
MDIRRIGIWTSYRPFGKDRAGEAAKLAEALGYGAWWVGGSPHVPDVRPILEATSALVAATGILNVWSNEPGDTAAADAALTAEFPGRFMLGIGIGHPEATSDYRRRLETMRVCLDGLDASSSPPPVDERCLAAFGPKMLDLAGERSAGTHSYFTTVDHTRSARDRLGPGARAVARDYAKLYLGLRNYTRNLLDLGLTEARLRRWRLGPAHRRGRPSRQPGADRRRGARAPRSRRRSRLPAAARRGRHPANVLDGAPPRGRPGHRSPGACPSGPTAGRRRRGRRTPPTAARGGAPRSSDNQPQEG